MLRVLGQDAPGRLEPVDAGQVHVHEHEVGAQLPHGLDRRLAGLGLPDHLEPVRQLDHVTGGRPEGRLIVHDENPH